MMYVSDGVRVAQGLGLTIYSHRFGKGSNGNLKGVLPTLINVATLAICLSANDGTVIPNGGLRSQEAANENFANDRGIPDSRHLIQLDGKGHAIDLIALTPGSGIDWTNMLAFKEMAGAVKMAAAILMVPIRQGCDWNMNGTFGEKNEHDWAHFEDPKADYMAAAVAEMHRMRRVLGIDTEPTIPTSNGGACFGCPKCGASLVLSAA